MRKVNKVCMYVCMYVSILCMYLSYDLFCEKFNLNTPFTLYHGLVAAIPKQWKRDVKNVSPSISQSQTCTLLRARPI